MHITGIVAEYDPFHNGHKAHIDSVRANGATHTVAVISGSFTQRGEPALLTKFDRAQMALANGIDLVVENPLPFSMASAERFAIGGVSVLHALGCVNTLSFGSECGDAMLLQQLAALMDTDDYAQALKCTLADGIPYACAKQQAVKICKGETLATVLDSPNNTLGVEYIRAANKTGAEFQFHTLKRIGSAHNAPDVTDNIASASYIRNLVRNENLTECRSQMPHSSADILCAAYNNGRIATNNHVLENALLAHLRQMTLSDFSALPYLSEGLENRLYQASRTAGSYHELLDNLKTRRYPTARLRRILWAALLKLPPESTFSTPLYIRILAMNDRGREILSNATPTLPILTRAAQLPDLSDEAQSLFALECRATDLHALCLRCPPPCGTDMTNKI